MRDPRLAEIDFLMDVERRGVLKVRALLSARDLHYGLDVGAYRDMVIALLLEGHIGGYRLRSDGGSMSVSYLDGERNEMLGRLGAGQPIDVLLSHSGRVHLWDLRDALLRDTELEPFGLRNKTSWWRDVAVRLRWATADEPLAIIFMDLDHFGAVNKEHGVVVGDEVLRAAFNLTKNIVGARGAVYRYGGEEVGILLPGTKLEPATVLAHELRSLVETEVGKQVPRLARAQTASIGVTVFAAGIEPEVATEYVDSLVREAKNSGRNRVVSHPYGPTAKLPLQ